MASIESLQDLFRPKGIYDIVRIKETSTRPRLRLPNKGDSPEEACDKLVDIHEAMKTRASLALCCQSVTLEDYLRPLSPHERILLTTSDDMQYLQYTKWHAGAIPPPLDRKLLTVCYIATHQSYNAEALNRMYRTTDYTLQDVECFLQQMPFLLPLFVVLRKLIALEADAYMRRKSLTSWHSGIKTVISHELEATIEIINRVGMVFEEAANEERQVMNQVLKALYARKAKLKACIAVVIDGPPIGDPWPRLPKSNGQQVETISAEAQDIATDSHSPDASPVISENRVEVSSPYNSDEDIWPGFDDARIKIRGGNFARRSIRGGRERPRARSSRSNRSRPTRTPPRPVQFIPRHVVQATSMPGSPTMNTTADWNTFAAYPDKNKLKMVNGMVQFHTPGARQSADQAEDSTSTAAAESPRSAAAEPVGDSAEPATSIAPPMKQIWKTVGESERSSFDDQDMDLLGDNNFSMDIPVMNPVMNSNSL